jgi:chaperonin GroEL
LKEKKLKIEDALNATRAAVEEGIVPGGGVALIRVAGALDKVKGDSDEMNGVTIVKGSLTKPLHQIAENAGKDPSEVLDKVLKAKGWHGYDAAKDEYVDLLKAGIVDPKKVTRFALKNAASVAALFLTMGGAVSELPDEKKCCGGSCGGGHGGMME